MTAALKIGAGRVMGLGGLFFRSRDPDALTAWYRDMLGVGAGCSGTGDPATGRFARIHDPEGNAIELWEPAAA